LLNSDWEVISALGEVVLVPEEDKVVAEALLEFYEANHRLDKLLEWAVAKEIKRCNTTSTLFRDSCEATKLLSVLYSRLGKEYLKEIAGPLVKDVVASGASFEIDPGRADKGIDVKENLKKLLSISEEFLHHIFDSIAICPKFLRRVMYHAQNEISQKFPEATGIVFGVFFFSRYLIPAIVSPSKYGLLVEPPSRDSQRGLILISKLLQNIANEIEFDDSSSNSQYKSELNSFIMEKRSSLLQFFDKLLYRDPFISFFPISSEVEQNAIATLSTTLQVNKDAIYQRLTKGEIKKQFLQILEAQPDLMTTFYRPRSNTPLTISYGKKKTKRDQAIEWGNDKVDKLEKLLEEEMRTRKLLEKEID